MKTSGKSNILREELTTTQIDELKDLLKYLEYYKHDQAYARWAPIIRTILAEEKTEPVCYKISMAVEIDDEFITDIIETAALYEGQWIDSFDTGQWTGKFVFKEGQYHIKPTDYKSTILLSKAMIFGALVRIVNKDCKLSESIRETICQAIRHNDASYIDAEAADVILQLAIFDEIVYG